MSTKTKEYIPAKTRNAIPDEDFAGPDRSFPVRNQSDLDAAARLIGHAADRQEVRRKIIAIARRKGLSLPDAWKSEDAKEGTGISLDAGLAYIGEPGPSPVMLPEGSQVLHRSGTFPAFAPKPRIATLRTCFLEDGARSLNGRIYPQEAVDRLVQSAQLALSTPNANPLTCYMSHGAADEDNSLQLTGKVTKVWKEGSRAWASIDIPDTAAGRDVAALAKSGYLKTSLRATGAELRMNQESGLPMVGGANLQLCGIDFTTTPGIPSVAIEDVVLESAGPQDISEVFSTAPDSLLLEEEAPEHAQPAEEGQSHEEPSQPEEIQEAPRHIVAASRRLQEAHDHLASVMDLSCKPMTEHTLEAGRAISANKFSRLLQAHDTLACCLGMECESQKAPASDTPQNGDDDMESSTIEKDEEIMEMTPEQAMALLVEQGYSVAPPKTAEEKLQEKFDAALAAQQTALAEQRSAFEAKLEEMRKALAPLPIPAPVPQRQSLVEGATVGVPANPHPQIYQHGLYIRERLTGEQLAGLADRENPLPEGIDATRLLREVGQMYLLKTGHYDSL